MKDCRKQNLLPFIINYVYSIASVNGNKEYNTRVYFYCFLSFGERYFANMKIILLWVNHSVRFGSDHSKPTQLEDYNHILKG